MKKNNFTIIWFIALCVIFHTELISQKFHVMTLNIRYDEKRDSLDNWHLRKQEMVELINTKNPYILGIQEGLFHQVQYLDSALVNYTYVGCGRDDGYQKGEFSAIFIDTTVFRVTQSGTYWLSDTPNKVSIGWDAALPRICTYALISHKKSKKSIWIFNTHFDHKGQSARLMSTELILKKVSELNHENQPYILMGDLNATPKEKPIQLLVAVHHKLPKKIKGHQGTFNGFGYENNTRRIDYIFSSKVDILKYMHLDAKRKNGRYISDHLPVYASIRL